MRVCLVGRDKSPSSAFEKVHVELERRGVVVSSFLGGGKPISVVPRDIAVETAKAGAVLLGMSNPVANASEEISIGNAARELGIPYGFYSDTFGAFKRPWFSDLMKDASVIFVINEEEMAEAKKLYPNALVAVSGNHSWEEASFPNYTREEVREKLGVSDDETMILVPGHKEASITAFLLMSVVHAVNQFETEERKFRVVLGPHPGDGVPPNKAYSAPAVFTNHPVTIVCKDKRYVKNETADEKNPLLELEGGMPTDDILPGADLLIESASTMCMSAAILRIPIISFLSEVSKIRNVSTFGQREWEPVLQDVATEVCGNVSDLYFEIDSILLGNDLKKRQAEVYPGFKIKGQFAITIADCLQELAR